VVTRERAQARGPLVVEARRWATPDGVRGVFGEGATVAGLAAGMGIPTALVLPSPAPAALLWAESDTAEPTGIRGAIGGESWRYRVQTSTGKPVTVVLVERDSESWAGPWAGVSGADACRALAVLREHLGVAWSHSTSRTAEELILSTHPRRRGGRTLDRSPQLPGPAAGALEPTLTAWQRPLTAVEAGRAWVHTFDANAAFLGCWQTVELGFGVPEHLADAGACELRLDRAGVWRVALPAGWSDGEGLPPIAPGLHRGEGWVTTPTLDRLRQHARETGQEEIVPEEGHAWPERSRFLRGAGERLRDARAAARAGVDRWAPVLRDPTATDEQLGTAAAAVAAAETVLDAVRDLYTITTGRFSTNREHAAGVWRRPDWGNTIRAEWRVNLHRKAARWAAHGGAPFAIATDAVAIASDNPDPAAVAAQLGMRLGAGLGEWKVQGRAQLAAVLPSLAQPGMRPAQAGKVLSRVFSIAAQDRARSVANLTPDHFGD
jgi:hypothetical protein